MHLAPPHIQTACVYTDGIAKHLIDLDEAALRAARAELGTGTIKDTVNAALRQATSRRERRVAAALDVLADASAEDRSQAWR
jgi:Arc/MetJ family transcription regulator